MESKDKICLLYDGSDSVFVKNACQIHIIYHEESKNFEKFVKANQEKQLYIELKEFSASALKRLRSLKEFTNWTLQLPLDMILKEDRTIDLIKFNGIKDCCNKYMFTDRIGNWEVLQFMFLLHPSEVYITNMLGFCLEDVKKVCDKQDVGIRVIANLTQSAWENSPNLTKFFIRPEDLDVYTPYVTGFDFIGDSAIQDVCFKVYSRGYWYGDLKELIIGFNESLDSRMLPQQYGEYRMNCKKRCVQGSRCHLCYSMKMFAHQLKEVNSQIIPKIKQKKE